MKMTLLINLITAEPEVTGQYKLHILIQHWMDVHIKSKNPDFQLANSVLYYDSVLYISQCKPVYFTMNSRVHVSNKFNLKIKLTKGHKLSSCQFIVDHGSRNWVIVVQCFDNVPGVTTITYFYGLDGWGKGV